MSSELFKTVKIVRTTKANRQSIPQSRGSGMLKRSVTEAAEATLWGQ